MQRPSSPVETASRPSPQREAKDPLMLCLNNSQPPHQPPSRQNQNNIAVASAPNQKQSSLPRQSERE